MILKTQSPRLLYLDLFAGVSGDMFVGAMLDLGVSLETLKRELQKLPVSGYRLETQRVLKRGISATQFKVFLEDDGGERLADADFAEHPTQSSGPSEQITGRQAGHHHSHAPARALADILALLDDSHLEEDVKRTAKAIFNRLGAAEARVHALPVEQVHFHEVGSLDAIIDIVCAAIALAELQPDRIIASPFHLGSGFIHASHGMLPIPAPAVANLVIGAPVQQTSAQGELTTPTGAAIVVAIADEFGPLPAMTVTGVGYGAGTRERDFPNALRAFLGHGSEAGAQSAQPTRQRDPYPEQHDAAPGPGGYHEGAALVLEASIDDMNPQFYEMLVENLLAAGALDVMLIPAQMKKSRPGVLLHIVAQPDAKATILEILFRDSTTLGVRAYPVTKHMLARVEQTVATSYGPVRVKVGRLLGRVVNVQPEYEDCRLLALKHGAPVKTIHAAALAAFTATYKHPGE